MRFVSIEFSFHFILSKKNPGKCVLSSVREFHKQNWNDNYFIQDKSILFFILLDNSGTHIEIVFEADFQTLFLWKSTVWLFFLVWRPSDKNKWLSAEKTRVNFLKSIFSKLSQFFSLEDMQINLKKSAKLYGSFRKLFCWLNIVNSICVKKKNSNVEFSFLFLWKKN